MPSHQDEMKHEHQQPEVHCCYEAKTGTWQYVLADPQTREAVIIDSVLDFDLATNQMSTSSADELLALVAQHHYTITRILEMHAHADRLTGFELPTDEISPARSAPT